MTDKVRNKRGCVFSAVIIKVCIKQSDWQLPLRKRFVLIVSELQSWIIVNHKLTGCFLDLSAVGPDCSFSLAVDVLSCEGKNRAVISRGTVFVTLSQGSATCGSLVPLQRIFENVAKLNGVFVFYAHNRNQLYVNM